VFGFRILPLSRFGLDTPDLLRRASTRRTVRSNQVAFAREIRSMTNRMVRVRRFAEVK
jgi:hypothetical protein